MRGRSWLLAVPLSLAACVGDIGDGPGGDSDVEIPTPEEANEVGISGARRLTSIEYRTSVFDLTGVDVTDASLVLPTDDRRPFDNDFTQQTASQALIDGADLLAGEIAAEVVADPTLRSQVVPCTPSGASDEACYRNFLVSFGRRVLRRPLTDAEIDGFVTHFMPHAEEASDFWVAVDSGLRAFLQHPHFLYRIEIGDAVPGVAGMYRLNDYEIATRLSYFLWGSTPPDWLLDEAEAGALTDGDKLKAAAVEMLAEPHALQRLSRFHAMWLSYEQTPTSEIGTGMMGETEALLKRYLLDEHKSWSQLLLAEESFLTPALATHYGLPEPANAEGDWVSYGDSGRRGLLSHGTFLGAVAKFDDTSPTQRGLLIRTRLFCQTIEKPPPELNVNTDEPPAAADPDACKPERYTMWKTDGCSQCHAMMDPVGFGLENYDSSGRFRETEPDRPDCVIDGKGELDGVGEFSGPAELGELMIESGEVDACVARQVYKYAMGRSALDEHDYALLGRLVEASRIDGADLRIDALVSEFVSSEAFQLRREEEVSGE
jgi:hypothetical protein